MAAWGTGLYQDDVAEDVKVDYYDCFREDGLDNEAAYQKMLSRYDEIKDDPEDGPVFWMALADIMWNLGKLTEGVKENALYHINAGNDVAKWEAESKEKAARGKKVLEKLKEKLESPMPKEKKLRKKRILKNKWQIGDMYTMPIEKSYPRFPEMKVKSLLLLKVDDRKGLSGHMEPLVCIMYLKEMYYEGMDLNLLEYAMLDNEYCFILGGIAGRPLPKNFTYVGNYGDLSKLEKLNIAGLDKLKYYSTLYPKALEDVFIRHYIIHVLNIDINLVGLGTVCMTEQEYQAECKRRQEREKERLAERKAKEYYRCPWEDGDTFYLPIREDVKGSRLLIENGYVGTVMVKVGTEEDDWWTTNLWPVILTCCVKKEYSNIEDLIGDDVFNRDFLPLIVTVYHGRDESIPENLMALGNIPDISEHCKRMCKKTGISWERLEERMQLGVIKEYPV